MILLIHTLNIVLTKKIKIKEYPSQINKFFLSSGKPIKVIRFLKPPSYISTSDNSAIYGPIIPIPNKSRLDDIRKIIIINGSFFLSFSKRCRTCCINNFIL